MRLILVLALCISFASCQKECPTCEEKETCDTCEFDLTKGLVAFYPFNGNASDASGNNLHAMAMNGAKLGSDYLGRKQSAAEFDGFDDYFVVPQSDKLNTDSVSVSMVVMVNTGNRRHTLVNKVNFDNVSSFVWGVGQSLATDQKWSFAVGNKTEDCSKPAVYDPSNAVYSSDPLEVGRWQNLVATFGTNGQRFYINGKLVAQSNRGFTSLKKCTSGNVLIGGWWKTEIISLDGKLDDVRIYNRVINQCEIDKLAENHK